MIETSGFEPGEWLPFSSAMDTDGRFEEVQVGNFLCVTACAVEREGTIKGGDQFVLCGFGGAGQDEVDVSPVQGALRCENDRTIKCITVRGHENSSSFTGS
jgi:hypothetical protein